MCAQSKVTDTYLASCSDSLLHSQFTEELHSWAYVTSNCYKFSTVHSDKWMIF